MKTLSNSSADMINTKINYVLQALQYDLECHSEDILRADENIKRATKEKRFDDVELHKKEKITLHENSNQIKKALKILNQNINKL